MSVMLQPERIQPNGVRGSGRILRSGTAWDFRPKDRADQAASPSDELLPLRAGYRDVYRRLQSLDNVAMRITQDAAARQDPHRQRNLLHFQARLGAVLQQLDDALPFLERVTGEADEWQTLDATGSRWLP